jgi:hypothetical protein
MVSDFKYILENYLQSRLVKMNASDLCYQSVCNLIPIEISNLINNEERYLVEGSVGVGNWASVPVSFPIFRAIQKLTF